MTHPIAVLAIEDDHQQDGDFNFDAPHIQDDFDLNLEAADHQNELQQMNSKPQWNLFFCNYFNDHIDSLG